MQLHARVPYPEGQADRAHFRRRHGNVFFPLGDWTTPEVLTFEPGRDGTAVIAGGQGHWFMVPEGVRTFWIQFGETPHFNRVSVWNPAGQRVWDLSYTDDSPERVTIEVPPEYAGQLWRATGGRFTIDPQIPPHFAVSRTKWFHPD